MTQEKETQTPAKTVKVKLLKAVIVNDTPCVKGDEVEVLETTAQWLIDGERAEKASASGTKPNAPKGK